MYTFLICNNSNKNELNLKLNEHDIKSAHFFSGFNIVIIDRCLGL